MGDNGTMNGQYHRPVNGPLMGNNGLIDGRCSWVNLKRQIYDAYPYKLHS